MHYIFQNACKSKQANSSYDGISSLRTNQNDKAKYNITESLIIYIVDMFKLDIMRVLPSTDLQPRLIQQEL